MPRKDPRGPKRRFHVWLYEQDIEDMRMYFHGRAKPNEIIRMLFHKAAQSVRTRVNQEIIDRSEPLNVQLPPIPSPGGESSIPPGNLRHGPTTTDQES